MPFYLPLQGELRKGISGHDMNVIADWMGTTCQNGQPHVLRSTICAVKTSHCSHVNFTFGSRVEFILLSLFIHAFVNRRNPAPSRWKVLNSHSDLGIGLGVYALRLAMNSSINLITYINASDHHVGKFLLHRRPLHRWNFPHSHYHPLQSPNPDPHSCPQKAVY